MEVECDSAMKDEGIIVHHNIEGSELVFNRGMSNGCTKMVGSK